jgi:hypothetical protein
MTTDDESAPQRTPANPDDLLVYGVAAVRAWFKAVDDHPVCRPSAEYPRTATIDETADLAGRTIALLEADEALDVLDDDAYPVELRKARGDVRDFVERARPWIEEWGWPWAFRPDRLARVQDIRERFLEEVDRPIKGAALKLLGSRDSATRDEVECLARAAIREKCEPMEGSEGDARRLYEELLGPYRKGPDYGRGPSEIGQELFCKLGEFNSKLTRWAEAREAEEAARQAERARVRAELAEAEAADKARQAELDEAIAVGMARFNAQFGTGEMKAAPQPVTAATAPAAGGRDAGGPGAGDAAAAAGGGAADDLDESDLALELRRLGRADQAQFVESLIGRPHATIDEVSVAVYRVRDGREVALKGARDRVHRYMEANGWRGRYSISASYVFKTEPPSKSEDS